MFSIKKRSEMMKKFFMMLMASMLLLSSVTYAVEVGNVHNDAKQMTTMSKAATIGMLEEAGLESTNVAILDKGEMAQTEGEYWWLLYGTAWGLGMWYIYNYYY